MKKFGYVLSGGGARCFGHLGVIKLLEELGIRPYAVSGTSAGAIVGALYASGKGPLEILEHFKNNSLFGWSNIAWQKDGFFSMQVLRKMLQETIIVDDFENLEIKLFVAATDLIEGKPEILSSGSLYDAVIASASIPVIFEPFVTGQKVYVDGGILNNFPLEPLEGVCDIIIGSEVNKLEKGIGNSSFFKTMNILDRCFHLAIAQSAISKKDKCDLFIEIPLYRYEMYDVKLADEIFDIGYNTALMHKEKLQELKEKSLLAR